MIRFKRTSHGCLDLYYRSCQFGQCYNRVCNDQEPLTITRKGEQSVLMLSLEDYKALEEIAYIHEDWEDYLYSSNAFRKLHSIIGTF
ncbi:type II toxin-antitoxin system Phd/YefM family antitoxin [Nitrospira sp. MA-1]|nr:type II toxin-antitoxin system Phd/YefM family antitoxin [Nitrospira sp. MA-1]